MLRRRGKDLAALVPIEDLERRREIEDRLDAKAARKALAEPGEIPHGRVRRKLGLKN